MPSTPPMATARFDFEAIGTAWRIDVFDEIGPDEKEPLLRAIMARIDGFDRAYSRFRDDSIVASISKAPGVYRLPDDAKPMLELYHEAYELTGGRVTPLIGDLMSDAGYDAAYSLKQQRPLRQPPRWEDAIEYSHPDLTMKLPALLDFGAAGKGYLVDIVGEVLRAGGIRSFGINAGGDILYRGEKPIVIGLEDPDDPQKVIGIYPLSGGSICGSAGNRRVWPGFTHIIDPLELRSPTAIRAVWTVADTALLADMLATCLFFVKPEVLAARYSFEHLIVYDDRSYERSGGFKGKL
ncbi:FAD:protein FMN transferase [Patescibacteria group bacterium]|nr:FAD:protein FMN transferase [Patescibacteria group bacterium]